MDLCDRPGGTAVTAGVGDAAPSTPMVIRPSMANEREHTRAIRWLLVLLAALVVGVAAALILGRGVGQLVLLIFPIEAAVLWLVRRRYVRTARATVADGELVVERPFLADRRIRAADVDLVLLLGAINGRSNPFTTDSGQFLLLGKGRRRVLIRMSGEIWPVRDLAEIAPALGVRAEAVARISNKQLRRRYRAASWPLAHPVLAFLLALPLFIALVVVIGTIVGPDAPH
jgi:hypothetical protein